MNRVLPLSDVMLRTPILEAWGRIVPSNRRGDAPSRLGMQNAATRLRQRKCGEEEYTIRRDGEDRDGISQRCRVRERADQERKQRADPTAEIGAEALPRSAQPCPIAFG